MRGFHGDARRVTTTESAAPPARPDRRFRQPGDPADRPPGARGGVYCEIHPFDKAEAIVDDYAPKAIILSGGPASVLEADSPRIGKKLFDLGVPLLAICYGQQLLCDVPGRQGRGRPRRVSSAAPKSPSARPIRCSRAWPRSARWKPCG
jgi:hypothetical protein